MWCGRAWRAWRETTESNASQSGSTTWRCARCTCPCTSPCACACACACSLLKHPHAPFTSPHAPLHPLHPLTPPYAPYAPARPRTPPYTPYAPLQVLSAEAPRIAALARAEVATATIVDEVVAEMALGAARAALREGRGAAAKAREASERQLVTEVASHQMLRGRGRLRHRAKLTPNHKPKPHPKPNPHPNPNPNPNPKP